MLDYSEPPCVAEWIEPESSWMCEARAESLEKIKETRELANALGSRFLGRTEVPEVSTRERFREQSDRWYRETQHLSSPSQVMMHPSYQAVMGMAVNNEDEIIRLMLKDMRDSRRPWFWALSYLTKENPIKPNDAGRLDAMIKAWLTWGRLKGKL